VKVSLTPHQANFIEKKMKTGGYRSRSEIVREALRVYELVEEEDYDADLEGALRHALRSPAKKYTRNHFSNLIARGKKPVAA
jgi:putative addiction module CopG family antidote